jgi:hypothetical protein
MANYSNSWNLKGGAVFCVTALAVAGVYRFPVSTQEVTATYLSVGRDGWSKSRGLAVSVRLPDGSVATASAPSAWRAPAQGGSVRITDNTTVLGFHLYRVADGP